MTDSHIKQRRGGAEIEVTKEMIEAGVGAMCGFYSDELVTDAQRVVAAIYRSMFSAASKRDSQPS